MPASVPPRIPYVFDPKPASKGLILRCCFAFWARRFLGGGVGSPEAGLGVGWGDRKKIKGNQRTLKEIKGN